MASFRRITPRRVKHPKPLVAVVLPVLGLQHMHLVPVLDRSEGAAFALRGLSHLGNQFFL